MAGYVVLVLMAVGIFLLPETRSNPLWVGFAVLILLGTGLLLWRNRNALR